jgi:hypothetical protein
LVTIAVMAGVVPQRLMARTYLVFGDIEGKRDVNGRSNSTAIARSETRRNCTIAAT